MRVLIDMDGIVVNLLEVWLATYNREWDDTLTVDSIRTWDTHDFVKEECGRRIYEILERPGLFEGLPPMRGAIEGVREMASLPGVEVKLATAAASPDAAREKIRWVRRWFYRLGWDRRDVFIGHAKHWLEADVLIDDSPNNLARWLKHRPDAEAMTIAYPYNEGFRGRLYTFADAYDDPERAWDRLVAGVRNLRAELAT